MHRHGGYTGLTLIFENGAHTATVFMSKIQLADVPYLRHAAAGPTLFGRTRYGHLTWQ